MHGARRWPLPVCMYAEEDTYMSYEPLCVVSSFKEEEDTWSHCLVGSLQGNIKLVLRENKVFPYTSRGDSFKKLHSLAQV